MFKVQGIMIWRILWNDYHNKSSGHPSSPIEIKEIEKKN